MKIVIKIVSLTTYRLVQRHVFLLRRIQMSLEIRDSCGLNWRLEFSCLDLDSISVAFSCHAAVEWLKTIPYDTNISGSNYCAFLSLQLHGCKQQSASLLLKCTIIFLSAYQFVTVLILHNLTLQMHWSIWWAIFQGQYWIYFFIKNGNWNSSFSRYWYNHGRHQSKTRGGQVRYLGKWPRQMTKTKDLVF